MISAGDSCIPRLRELGFGITVDPTGAFYVLANAKTVFERFVRPAFDILKEAKVGVAPGIDFGSNAEGYLVSRTPIHWRTSRKE